MAPYLSKTRMIIVNAMYFKGDWATPFDEKATKQMDFWISKSGPVKVEMMEQKGKFGLIQNIEELGGASALSMPYAGHTAEMVIVLPNGADLMGLINKMSRNLSTARLLERGSFKVKEVKVSIPRFKIESSLDLKGVLRKIGLTDMFDEKKADFSGIIEGPMTEGNLYISAIKQKAVLEGELNK